jgi:Protein of unknown function (DUF1460)
MSEQFDDADSAPKLEMGTGEAGALLERLSGEKRLESRIDMISAHFLDRPYIAAPLRGGPGLPETLSANLDGFDCVTYIETVLALALSNSTEEFADVLRNIRYEGGEVDWLRRNHYMTGWVEKNEASGIVTNITEGAGTKKKTRLLNVVPGLEPAEVSFRCFPKNSLARARGLMRTGDLILFASTKKELDVFHTGVLVVNGDEVSLRHATRAAGKVIEEPLTRFLKNNGMSGFILIRPVCHQ